MYELTLFLAALLAGSIAALAGFGIGSVLTPIFALHVPLKVAVAAVAIPHLIATALRFWLVRAHVDRSVLWSFGIFSALGGLLGALAHRWASSPALTIVFGSALVLAATSELTGLARRMQWYPAARMSAGFASGLLGGLVGNQGGIRSAALLGFRIAPLAFVATATAVALLVDAARLPVYLWLQGDALRGLAGPIAIATAGCVAGTFWGKQLLEKMPPSLFRRLVALLILALGAYMLATGIAAL